MAKYRKLPVVIEASQWFRFGDHPDVKHPPDSHTKDLVSLGKIARCGADQIGYIRTPEGGHLVIPGDWIVTGVDGEHYPCKDYIFRKTYEPV